jgi:hypothetical protein
MSTVRVFQSDWRQGSRQAMRPEWEEKGAAADAHQEDLDLGVGHPA